MKVIYQFYRNAKNGFYRIRDSSNGTTKTYCQMTSLKGCSGGGWTLVMKTDGRKVCTRKETCSDIKTGLYRLILHMSKCEV